MMLAALHNIATTGLLLMAGDVQCAVPKAPVINITPTTAEIQYDFSRSEKDLTARGSNTISPYPVGTDTATGGLRVDKPEIDMNMKWGYSQYSDGETCLWYDSVDVTISLHPHIYVASEFPMGPCRDAILGHERHHVDVDREIINKYSKEIGRAIEAAVNETGAIGPYPKAQVDEVSKSMVAHIRSAIDSQKLLLEEEERRRQAQVDTLQEYKRVSDICHMTQDMP